MAAFWVHQVFKYTIRCHLHGYRLFGRQARKKLFLGVCKTQLELKQNWNSVARNTQGRLGINIGMVIQKRT